MSDRIAGYPARRVLRLEGYDYSSAGMYFVTICTYNKLRLFGDVIKGEMVLNDAGRQIHEAWAALPRLNPGVECDVFAVMPNHVHGLLLLTEVEGPAPTIPRVMQGFKAYTRHCYVQAVKIQGWPPIDRHLWQKSYHDRVIRNERELAAIREYICHNALLWDLDREYVLGGWGPA